MKNTIESRPLSPALGAEVVGLDLRKPLSQRQQEQLRQLFDKYYLLVFHDQDLSVEDHIRFVGTFGPVSDEKGDGKRHSFVSNVRPDGLFGDVELTFHADYEFRPDPPPAISLYGCDVQLPTSPTIFASLADAYRRLSAAQRQRLEGRMSVYADDYTRKMQDASYGKRYSLIALPEMPPDTTHPRTERPLFYPHPRSGEPLLLVSEMHSSHISGFSAEENEIVLRQLFDHLLAKEHIYSHHWHQGDLIIWDNLALQHGRPPQKQGMKELRRTLRRVVVSDKTAAELLGPYYNRPGSFEAARA
ncbi:MAG: TauD/TfdA family dioxygenase [Betaproteobacteria bacterium]|nr:TauD/TfdA family dioxygenase [Betaproteobacteria bacterium]